jgi:DNA-binding transcriptional regulator GbsR (MarR family)
MTKQYIETLKETFSDPKNFSPEKLQGLIQETVTYFREMQGKLASKDPEAREEAMKAALEMKQALEDQMETICQLTGLDPAQLSSLGDDTSRMAPVEKEAFETVKEQLKELRPVAAAHNVFKKRAPKLGLVG